MEDEKLYYTNYNLGPQNCYYRAKIYVEIVLGKLSIGYWQVILLHAARKMLQFEILSLR